MLRAMASPAPNRLNTCSNKASSGNTGKFPESFLAVVLCLSGCTEPPPTPKSTESWSNEQEVIYQTQQVIRYEEEQYRVELARLNALGTAPLQNESGEQGKHNQQQHRQIAETHEER